MNTKKEIPRHKMSTLLQISIEVNSGSVGRIAEQIGQAAMKQGWESYITYARNHLPSKSKTIKIGNKFDIYWHGINTRLFDNHCLCSTWATRKLVKQIKEINPDIIILHHIHGYFLNMMVLFEYFAAINTPIVWIFHDCWAFTGHCAYFDFIECEKWITGCHNCPQKNSYPASRLLDRSRRNYKIKKHFFTSIKNMTIVPVSYWLGKLVQKSFLNIYPVHVIKNGIDTDVFSPKTDLEAVKRKYNISGKFIILGVAGVWEKRKGLSDFILLNNLIDHKENVIMLVGLNKKQKKKIPKDIIAIERTENTEELACLYSLSNVFVNPTLEDTFPTTNLESLACGAPVITYRTGGSVESVSDDVGIIVEKGDVEGLYKAINEIKKQGKAYYSANCRKKAAALYDRRGRFADYLNLFNQLLNKS